MKNELITTIEQAMLKKLDNAQLQALHEVLVQAFKGVSVTAVADADKAPDNTEILEEFLSAKRIEGCSEKSLSYYRKTITAALDGIGKGIKHITTDDLRAYLTDYQAEKKSSKVTMDNIRRILSSFFSWLEDEDYIIKSPVRRIHKVKTSKTIKETYTDENLELMRDNCVELRDLAMIDMLASTGMRVGEMVLLNRSDIDFNERECVVVGKGDKERMVYFDARTKLHLQSYLASRTDSDPALFVSLRSPHKRLTIGAIELRLREMGRKLGINKVHPHKFRRTLATMAIDKGMPIEQLQRLLGHQRIDTTLQYAYIVRRHDMSNKVIYELADPFLAVYSHKSVVNSPFITQFLDTTKEVISERDPIFDEPFDRHFYLSAFKKSKYSHSIKSGMARTLILLALYADYQSTISIFVRDLLKMIQSIMDWAYISQYIESLCEAAPDSVIDFIENSIDNHTELLDLFTAEESDILMGRHYYTNILWCLERLLPCKDYAVRVVRILFQLGNNIDKCSTGNNPRDDISKVFCTWYNVSALEIEEKIELAKIGVENYPFFWDILYNEIGKNTTIFGNSSFTYRKTDKIIPYTNRDLFHFYVSYTEILLTNVNDNLDRLIKLLDLLPNCTDELFISIQEEMKMTVKKLDDPEKEQIKTKLRKTIYHHRHFAKSDWAAPAERISKQKVISPLP